MLGSCTLLVKLRQGVAGWAWLGLLSLNLSPLNDDDVCVLELQDSTANARSAFSWCLFIAMAEEKKIPRRF